MKAILRYPASYTSCNLVWGLRYLYLESNRKTIDLLYWRQLPLTPLTPPPPPPPSPPKVLYCNLTMFYTIVSNTGGQPPLIKYNYFFFSSGPAWSSWSTRPTRSTGSGWSSWGQWTRWTQG